MSVTDQPSSSDQAPERLAISDDGLLNALAGVVRALRAHAVSHPELRAQLAVLGKAFLEIAEAPPAVAIQDNTAKRENLADPAALLSQAGEPPASPSLPSTPNSPVVPLSAPASPEDLQRLIRVMRGLESSPFETGDVRSDQGIPLAPVIDIDDSVDLQILVNHCALKAAVRHTYHGRQGSKTFGAACSAGASHARVQALDAALGYDGGYSSVVWPNAFRVFSGHG